MMACNMSHLSINTNLGSSAHLHYRPTAIGRPSRRNRTPSICNQAAPSRRSYNNEGYNKRPDTRQQPNQPLDPIASQAQMWLDRIYKLPLSGRSVAFEQLLRIEEEGAFAGLVSGSGVETIETDDQPPAALMSSRHAQLSDRDRRQVTNIVAGVTRWRRRLDYIITHLPKKTDIDGMDPPLRVLLRIGAFELLESRLPAHALNDHVEFAKVVMHEGCGKVANGVLREIARCREGNRVPAPPLPTSPAHAEELAANGQLADVLATGFSHPTWLVERWLKHYGLKGTVALLKRNNTRPVYTVRLAPSLNTEQLFDDLLEQADVEAKPSEYLPGKFMSVDCGLQSLLASGLLTKGQIQVQDEAAGLVVLLLNPQPGESILDACAAPGGKTLFSASLMNGQGSLYAMDISQNRLRALENAAAVQGVSEMISFIASDLRNYSMIQPNMDLPIHFDKVLVDAPCSGTGVLAKRADLRWRRTPSDVMELLQLQDELLDAAADIVKPGGLLVYSTCSLEPEENQGRVAAFLKRHPEYQVDAVDSEALGIPAQCITPKGFLQMLPHVHKTDGAFGARLRRTS